MVAVAALGVAPAAARATVTSSTITNWVSSQPGTPSNSPYLVSYDNSPATTMTVSGTAVGTGNVDLACYYGSGQVINYSPSFTVDTDGRFQTTALSLRSIAGHACRLRAVPAGYESTSDTASFAGPQVAVSEAESVAVGSGPNAGKAYSFYLSGTTFTGSSGWSAPGTPSLNPNPINPGACGGSILEPIDPSFSLATPALDCVGSLLSDDLGAWGGRSEVQIDGRNAYDAASAQSLFTAADDTPASQTLDGFPTLSTTVNWNPSSGLVSSSSVESWVACNGANSEHPTFATCSSFVPTGVQLERDISESDGGRVVTMTDTWSSTDGSDHALDLLYDDYVGIGNSMVTPGYQFPGQGSFSAYAPGQAVPGAGSAPGSILVRSNMNAADGDPAESIGAITFSSAPSGFRFAGENEFEERQVLHVPAGGSTRLTYIYSTGYSVADVQALALAAQDRIASPEIAITSPANGASVSTPTATVAGLAGAGSGIASLAVAGRPVAVGAGGAWSTQVPLNPGANTITAVATDGAGATVQAQVTVLYHPPPAPPPPVRCRVPRTKGLKLPAAEKAIRRAHCRVGKIKRIRSRKVRRGRVVDTRPPVGRRLRAGSKVELFVSNGAAK